jgi:nucleoside-diphosphate-sugar epimerase
MNRISEGDLNIILNNTCEIFNENFVRGSNIFITGATGFFGKWLLESFIYLNRELNLNSNIYVLSRDPENFLKRYPFYEEEKNIIWIKGDIRSFEFSSQKIDYIIHAATDADAKLNNESPLLMLDTITEGTKRMLEFAQKQPELKAFLLTSSGAVYGKQPDNVAGISETDGFYIDINHPNSAYSEGKRLAELYCSIYAKNYNIPVRIARCFAFVGPYLPLDKHFAIGNFIRDGLTSQNILIKGDGSPLRSYMYAADLTIWLWTILLKGDNGDVYNVGSDKAISIKELAMMIAGNFPGISVKILNQTHPTDRNQNYVPDVTKFKKKFNLSPKIDLEEAILKTISYNKEDIK